MLSRFFLLSVAIGAPVSAQVAPSPNLPGTTILVMPSGLAIGFAPVPETNVRVPPHAAVILAVGAAFAGAQPSTYQWSRNYVPIPGATAATLQLFDVSASDSGSYTVSPNLAYPFSYSAINLDVVPDGHVANVSSRLSLKAGADMQILGFVVSGTTRKRMLVRAVGPSLAPYGVPGPASLPRIKLFDSRGAGFGRARTAQEEAAVDWPALFRQAGAFPLTGGERLTAMADVQVFPPGVYSVRVSDDAGLGGTVLVEIYELP